MTRHQSKAKRRLSSGRLMALAALSMAAALGITRTMRAGENLDAMIGGQIRDTFWDSRLFSGTPGYPQAILWFHNPAGIPGGVTASAFEARVQAGFDTWERVDDGFPEEPLVPIVNFGGQTAMTDPFALDGFNVITWELDFLSSTLAVTPCWVLTQPTTTLADASGNTVMPVSSGPPIPFPGPAGVTYPAGAMIDCGMRFNSFNTWSTSDVPSPSGFDVQSVATHEGGHFFGVSHSSLGNFTAISATSATMLPFAAPGDDTFRTLEEDDKASVVRTYARTRHGGPLPQTVGGRGAIRLTLLKGGACEPATGVSVAAYPTTTGIDGPNRVETFSGSHLRRGIPDEPFYGSASLNLSPLPPGESYTIYAKTFERGEGALSSQRYNYTTINSNLVDPQNQSRTFDHLATVTISAGESIDLGNVGILGCWVPDPASQVNLVADFITAPATAQRGHQVAVTSGFSNQGTVASGPFDTGVYFSLDQTITTDDLFTGFTCSIPGLLPGATATCNGSVNIPGAAQPGSYFVGLLVDSRNQIVENAELDNGIAAGNPTTVEPNPLDPIVNGSFETGDLTGWSIHELTPASNPNLPLSVRGAGVEYPAPSFVAFPYIVDYFTSAPTDGAWAVLNDFNGNDPATTGFVNRRELYQDITLPPGTTTLEFDYRAAWELFRFNSTQDRTFDVEVEPAGGGATLLDQTILVAPNLTIEEDTDNPTGGVGDYLPGRVDLSAFAGQSVRLKFVWNIPEPGTGFGFFQLDNIRLNTAPAANTAPSVEITSPADGSSITSGQPITLAATAVDGEDGNIGASLAWSSSRDGVIGSGASVSTGSLSVGVHTITATVRDSGGLSASDSIAVTVTLPVPNRAPVVVISTPVNGSVVTAGSTISFAGSATDPEDGNISTSLSWSSSRDGVIGTGASVTTSTLSGGSHVITASVGDTGGLTGSATISMSINVENRATADFSTARGTIGAGTSFQNTWIDDAVYEVLTEVEQGGGSPAKRRSLLEHTWTFNVAAGTQYVFKVNAYRSGSEDNFTFSYSRDNAIYTPMVTVTATSDGAQQAYVFPGDVRGTLYVRVQDTDSAQGNRQLDSLFVDSMVVTSVTGSSGVTPPAVTITAPSNDAVVSVGATVSFAGSAIDAEDGNLSGSLTWTSSIDGVIGTGPSFSTSALSAGQHTIAATVTDSSGVQGTSSIAITVRSAASVTLSATGYKAKGIQRTDLAWSDATTPNVTIARNGVIITTVPNPGLSGGTYTDNIGTKGTGTYTYQVCEAVAGGACSNVVTVTF